ncbi:MAG: hypothetical protein GY694_17010, partial [Gammaproteobacteria bacterium]|nr:hypothetical protein [Gammaproteobacteria bacterium]
MYTLDLHIPHEFKNAIIDEGEVFHKLQKSLEKIDYDNNPQQQNKILSALKNINQIQINVKKRLKIMALFEPISKSILAEVINKHEFLSLPFSKKQLEVTQFIQIFLFEMAIGYKIVIQNIVDSEELMSQHLGTLLPEACYKSITTLSLLLIERYQQYL